MRRSSWQTGALRAGYRGLVRPLLFRYGGGDPERVHEAMIDFLAKLPAGAGPRNTEPVTVAGIEFANRVGLAAGMDKDALAARAWGRFGFGFAELGTVTGQAQPGNPKPRVFRLKASQAIINRMGFNNAGAAAMAKTLERLGVRRGNRAVGIPLGISIGKTKTVPLEQAIGDYLGSIRALHRYADYFAVNVSSPNTPGLRKLQAANELAELLTALVEEAAGLDQEPVPIFVKLAPDLDSAQLRETLAVINASGVAGVIATNTTLARDGLAVADTALAAHAGGLSGKPLTSRALQFVSTVAEGSGLPLIGVGGIMTPQAGRQMFDAGAQLLQLYTGFIYEGPALVRGISELRDR